MKDEIREFTVPIRMTFSEKEKITARAKKVGKTVSEFMRYSALGYDIKERPDSEIFLQFTKAMRNVEIGIRNLGREAHNTGFIDELKLKRERDEWNNLIIDIKKKLL